MLVFTRREADSIQIGDDVEVTMLEIKGKSVKNGINAPRDLDVHRSEVYVKLWRLLASSTKAGPSDTG